LINASLIISQYAGLFPLYFLVFKFFEACKMLDDLTEGLSDLANGQCSKEIVKNIAPFCGAEAPLFM
jgi:hypothetical protein